MLIESLAQKTKLALMTVLATIGGCTLICGFTVWCCISLVTKEREQIYILDGDIPFLAQRAQLEANFTMEAKHISSSSISISLTCLPITTTSSGRSARRCIWRTVPPSSRSRHWMRTDSTPTSSLPRQSVPSCATPSNSTNTKGSSPTTERSSSSAVPGT